MSYLLSALDDDQIDVVLARAAASLHPGGLLVVHDFVLDDDEAGPQFAALWFLQYLAYHPGGVSFSAAELGGRLRAHGFVDPSVEVLIPEITKVILSRKGRAMTAAPTRRVAVGITPMETRHEVVLQLAARAEALGYDAFLLAEGWGHDATALLGAVAARTRTIRIGTGVLNVWGRSAAGVAMLACVAGRAVRRPVRPRAWARAPRSSPRACTTSRSPGPGRSPRCGHPAGAGAAGGGADDPHRNRWHPAAAVGRRSATGYPGASGRARSRRRAGGRRAGRRLVPVPAAAVRPCGRHRAAPRGRGGR